MPTEKSEKHGLLVERADSSDIYPPGETLEQARARRARKEREIARYEAMTPEEQDEEDRRLWDEGEKPKKYEPLI